MALNLYFLKDNHVAQSFYCASLSKNTKFMVRNSNAVLVESVQSSLLRNCQLYPVYFKYQTLPNSSVSFSVMFVNVKNAFVQLNM